MTPGGSDEWALPTPVSDVEVAFPAGALDLMPSREVCEAGLAALPDGGAEWLRLQRVWFSRGLAAGVEFHMRPGVDGETAFRHLCCIQGSYAPKHEHKEAAVAYLASRWCEKVVGYER